MSEVVYRANEICKQPHNSACRLQITYETQCLTAQVTSH